MLYEKKHSLDSFIENSMLHKSIRHKIKKTTPPTCTHCNNHPLTITHILHECHTTETQRQKYGINANINLTSQNDIQN